MIRISKEAAQRLHNEFGVPYGEGGISTTVKRPKTYYLCESERNLRSLTTFALNDEATKILKGIDARNAERKKKYKKLEKHSN